MIKLKPINYLLLFSGLLLLTACDDQKSFRNELEQTVETINKKCPTLLDSETKIEGVEIIEPNTLVYKYTLVNVLKQNVDTHQFYMTLWPGILSTIKISPEMKKLRENNTIIQYVYQDKFKNPFYTFTVKPKDYN